MVSFLDSVALQPGYGYVAAVAIGSVFVEKWAGVKVGQARKKFNVPYPQMYAETSHAHAVEFNCVQRAHQNLLENYTSFLLLLGLAALVRPTAAAALGAVRLLGFVGYVSGYSTGKPAARINKLTGVGYIGLLGLLGLSIEASARIIMNGTQ